MNRKQLLKEVGFRLKEMREASKCSQERMAAHFGIGRSAYTKNENGETFLSLNALSELGNTFDVSLDWLICNKGPMFYKEKARQGEIISMEVVKEDVLELLEHMERLPLLRYEVLSFFQRFKVENKELVDSAVNHTTTDGNR
jgi:transcriptional regulator with XRE-family HTH domain